MSRSIVLGQLIVGIAVALCSPLLALAQDAAPPPPDAPRQSRGDGPRGRDGGDRPAMRRGGFFRGAGGFGEAMQPEFAARDMPLFVEGLTLDEGQMPIVEALLTDYVAAFELGLEPVSATMQEVGPQIMRSFMSPETREKFRGAFEGVQEEIRKQVENGGAEPDPDTMRAMVEERMATVMEEVRKQRQASGEEKESQRLMGEMIEKLEGWRAQRAKLREQLISGVKAQLSEAQTSKWPTFERKLDREKTLPRGRLSGESTDLLRIVDRLELDDATLAAAKEALDNYELRLADALKARNDYAAQSEPRLMRAIQELDVKAGLDIVRKQTQYRVRLRDVNEESRTLIAAGLPAEASAKFTEEALRDAFERIFRPTRADDVLEYIRSLELSPEVVHQIDAIEQAYRQELKATNDKLVALTKKEEPQEQMREAERFAGFMSGNFQPRRGGEANPDGGDPMRDGFRDRREMAEKYIERLAAVLTPDQAASMPKQRERRAMGGGMDNLPPEMRDRIMQRVDTNGNGQIDPDEQEAAQRMFRERFGGGGGPGGGRPGGAQ